MSRYDEEFNSLSIRQMEERNPRYLRVGRLDLAARKHSGWV